MTSLPVIPFAGGTLFYDILRFEYEGKHFIRYFAFIDDSAYLVAFRAAVEEIRGIDFQMELGRDKIQLPERVVILNYMNTIGMNAGGQFPISRKKRSFFRGGDFQERIIVYIFLEKGVESQNTQIRRQLAQVIIAGKFHRKNLI